MPRFRIAIAGIMLLSSAMSLFFITHDAQAANITWDGGGVTNNWSEDANWSGDVEPGAGDVAIFNGTSTKNATIDATFTGSLAGVNITSAYTGTITQARSLTVGTTGWVMAGGTFTGSADTLDLNGVFTLSGGIFTAPTGTFSVSGTFTHTAGGTFTHNSGTVIFDGTTNTSVDVSTSEAFNNITVNKTGGTNFLTVSSGDTLTAHGTLTLTDGNISTGTVDAKASIVHGAGFDGGTGTITVTAGAQDINLTAGGQFPHFIVSVTRIINAPGSGTVTFDGDLTVGAGSTFVGGAGNIDINDDLTISGATTTFTAPSATLFIASDFIMTGTDNDANTFPEAGDFVPNGGTVSFDGTGGGSFGIEGTSVNTTEPFNNVIIDRGNSDVVSIQAGDILRIDGSLALNGGNITSGTAGHVDAYGDITHGAAFDGGNGSLRIVGGSSDINLTAGGAMPTTTLNVARNINGVATGTVTFDGDLILNAGDFVGGAGTLDMSSGVDVVISGGDFLAPAILLASGEFTHTSGTFSHNNGLVNFDGSGIRAIDVPATEIFNDVIFGGTGGGYSIANNDNLTIIGDLSLTNGEVFQALGGATVTFTGTSITHASTYDGGNLPFTISAGVTITPAYTANHLSFINPLVLNHASAVLQGPVSELDRLTIEGNSGLNITLGTVNNGAGTIAVTGTLAKTGGTFNGNTGTVTLGAATATAISGTFTFYNLALINTASVTYTFPAGVTTTVGNGFKVVGESPSQPITLNSSSGGSAATIAFGGDAQDSSVYFANIQDITYTATDPALCIVDCQNLGNNTGWDFAETIQVSELAGVTSESGGNFTFTVVLSHLPDATVTVPVSSTDTSEATVSPSSLVFTTVNWATPQTVTVTGVNDSLDDGAVAYGITLAAATSGDSDYAGVNPSDVSGRNLDDDTAAGVFDFDVDSQYLHENVLGSVVTYETEDFGYATFGDGGFTPVSIAGTKILPGCRTIDGTSAQYSIVHVRNSATGEIILAEIPDDEPVLFPTLSGTLSSISCTSSNGSTVGPIVDSLVEDVGVLNVTGTQIIHELTGDDLWVSYDSGVPQGLVRYDLATETQTAFSVGGLSPIDFAMDDEPTRQKMWAIDGTTDQLASVTFGGSSAGPFVTLAEPEVITVSNNNDADPGNDAVWVGYDFVTNQPARITKFDADSGSPFDTDLATSTFALELGTGGTVISMVYEEPDNVLWVALSTRVLVKINPETGAPANGTLANSTYPMPVLSSRLYYDEARDVIWFGADHGMIVNSDLNLETYRFDTDTGRVTGTTRVDASSNLVEGIHLDSGTNTLFTFDFTGSLFSFNADTLVLNAFNNALGAGSVVSGAGYGPQNFATGYYARFGGSDEALYERFVTFLSATYANASASGHYYTVVSGNAAQQNVSAWTDITSADVTENLNSQTITYAVSFDGRASFKMYEGAWRVIASSSAADHGGTDGAWYYRNDANAWTAAPRNNAQDAVSLAIQNGPTLNRMTGAEIEALVEAQWEEVGGFDANATTTLDLATTFFTSNLLQTPSVDNVAFSFAGATGAGITVSTISGNTTEAGGTGTFTVVLDTLPTGDVVVNTSSNDSSEGVVTSGQVLTFNTGNWNTPQVVTVTGQDDAIDDGDIAYSITNTVDVALTADTDYDAIDPDDVAVTNVDDDASGGGGGGGGTSVSDVSVTETAISLSEVDVCSEDKGDVTVTLEASRAAEFMLSNEPEFILSEWQDFIPDENIPATVGANGERVYTMVVNWTLEEDEDGNGIVYAKFRTGGGNVSSTIEALTRLAAEPDACLDDPDEEEEGGNVAVPVDELPAPCDPTVPRTGHTYTDEEEDPRDYPRDFPEGEDGEDRGPRDMPEEEEGEDRGPRDMPDDEEDPREPHAFDPDLTDPRTPREVPEGAAEDPRGPRDMPEDEDGEDRGPRDMPDDEEGEDRGPHESTEETDPREYPHGMPEDEAPCITTIPGVSAGDFVRTADSSTVFYVDSSSTLHPFPDLQTYLTYADQCNAVTYVDGQALSLGTLGPPMLPNAGRTLVKFPGDTKVYAVEDYPDSVQRKILRWISSEDMAVANYGPKWADYVIEVKPEQIPYFEFGEDIMTNESSGLYRLRSRAALNNAVGYDLYIVNPDGTKRRSDSDFTRIDNLGQGLFRFMFEDSGRDTDFNDVVMEVNPTECLNLQFSVMPLESLWHHQIGVEIYYEDKLQEDVILWTDSHAAVNNLTVIDVTNASLIRENVRYEVQEETYTAAAVTNPFDNSLQAIVELVKRPFTRE